MAKPSIAAPARPAARNDSTPEALAARYFALLTTGKLEHTGYLTGILTRIVPSEGIEAFADALENHLIEFVVGRAPFCTDAATSAWMATLTMARYDKTTLALERADCILGMCADRLRSADELPALGVVAEFIREARDALTADQAEDVGGDHAA
jgi:hypothetical protein